MCFGAAAVAFLLWPQGFMFARHPNSVPAAAGWLAAAAAAWLAALPGLHALDHQQGCSGSANHLVVGRTVHCWRLLSFTDGKIQHPKN